VWDKLSSTLTGYVFVSIIQQPDISIETSAVRDCLDLFIVLLLASSVETQPPKGGGGCFPGWINNPLNSFRMVSAMHGKRWSQPTFQEWLLGAT
jgi:hypothetical protein